MGELDRLLRMIQGGLAGQRGGLGSMTDLEMREPVGIGRMTENEMMSNPSGLGSMSEYELAQMMQPRGIGNLSASEAGLLGSILGKSSGLGMTTDTENQMMQQLNNRLQQLKDLEQQLLLQKLIF